MIISSNIASLQANQTFMNTNANNIANVNTDGFIPQSTQITDNGSTKSQTNITKEITDQVIISGVNEANVSAIRTQDEMFGTLLDIKA